jgi:hypothetical protein
MIAVANGIRRSYIIIIIIVVTIIIISVYTHNGMETIKIKIKLLTSKHVAKLKK